MRRLAALVLCLLTGAGLAQQLPPGGTAIGPTRRGEGGRIAPVATEFRCSKDAICVPPGGDIAEALGAAREGDTVEIGAGTYQASFIVPRDRMTVRGVGGRPHITCAGMRPARDKACIVIAGDGVTLDNLEISGAEISDSLGANAACIRNEPDRSFTLANIVCHHSQNGLLASGGSVVIEGSEFYENSWTEQTHNVYLSGNCPSVRVRNSIFREARVAHEFKSRCRSTSIADSTFRSVTGSRAIDIPDGGETTISNVLIVRGRAVENPDIVGFAPESCKFPGTLRLVRSRIRNDHPQATITNYGKCEGQAVILEGISYEGIRPTPRGYVLER